MKKLTSFLICIILASSIVCLSGCNLEKFREEHTFESGNFICYALDDWNYVEVIDLSEEGHKQKTIIMPESINGKPYLFIDSSNDIPFYDTRKNTQFSENDTLEKIYFENNMPLLWNFGKSGVGSFSETIDVDLFSKCSELKKVIINNDGALLYEKIENDNDTNIYSVSSRFYVYTNYSMLPYFERDEGVYEKCYLRLADGRTTQCVQMLANVEFMYNYDDAPNSGYYWIDDIDDGEKLEVMPPEPTREGYIFGGWYQEEDCINEFDFESAILKPELAFYASHSIAWDKTKIDYDLLTYPDNYVTFIYAKWIEE